MEPLTLAPLKTPKKSRRVKKAASGAANDAAAKKREIRRARIQRMKHCVAQMKEGLDFTRSFESICLWKLPADICLTRVLATLLP